MNLFLWVLQCLAALVYGSSSFMKLFLFDKVSRDVPSFSALPRKVWTILGVVELLCTVGLIVPDALHRFPHLTILAAVILAVESLLFIWVHLRYREPAPVVMSVVLSLVMAFVAFGRLVLHPVL